MATPAGKLRVTVTATVPSPHKKKKKQQQQQQQHRRRQRRATGHIYSESPLVSSSSSAAALSSTLPAFPESSTTNTIPVTTTVKPDSTAAVTVTPSPPRFKTASNPQCSEEGSLGKKNKTKTTRLLFQNETDEEEASSSNSKQRTSRRGSSNKKETKSGSGKKKASEQVSRNELASNRNRRSKKTLPIVSSRVGAQQVPAAIVPNSWDSLAWLAPLTITPSIISGLLNSSSTKQRSAKSRRGVKSATKDVSPSKSSGIDYKEGGSTDNKRSRKTNEASTECRSTSTNKTVGESSTGIPSHLISVLAPKGLKSLGRLPQTPADVLKRTLPRHRLPRSCKTKNSSMNYTEDSDDDLYVDSIVHDLLLSPANHQEVQPRIPVEVVQASSSLSPQSSPTVSTASETSLSPPVATTTTTTTTKATKRPPSRPRKGVLSAQQQQQQQFQAARLGRQGRLTKRSLTTSNSSPSTTTTPTKRKRGRPPTPKSVRSDTDPSNTAVPAAVEETLVIRRPRGQSLKGKLALATATATATTNVFAPPSLTAGVSVHKRRRGRPRRNPSETDSSKSNKTSSSGKASAKTMTVHKKVPPEPVPGRRQQRDARAAIRAMEVAGSTGTIGRQDETGVSYEGTARDGHEVHIGMASPPLQSVKEHKGQLTATSGPTIHSIVKAKKSPVKLSNSVSPSASQGKAKVRFAPLPTTTTTFSVKIRVKTSTSPAKRKEKGSRGKKRRRIEAPPGLSESAVQSIASQITQACLMAQQEQSPAMAIAAETVHGDESGSDGNEMDEDSDSDTSSAEGSDEQREDASIDREAKLSAVVQGGDRQTCAPSATFQRQNSRACTSAMAGQREIIVERDFDTRSIASEITMDIDLAREPLARASVDWQRRPFKDNSQVRNGTGETFEKNEDQADDVGMQHFTGHGDDEDGHLGNLNQEKQNNSYAEPQVDETPKQSLRQARWSSGDSLAGSVLSTPAVKERRESSPSRKRRRRRALTGNDSLAGGSLASTNSVNLPRDAASPRKVLPRKVSPKKSGPSPRGMHVNMGDRAVYHNDETVVTDRSTDSRKSAWSIVDGRCGRCSGCRRELDCMTCTGCIRRLQDGICPENGKGCLRRICKVLRHQTHTDSLGQLLVPDSAADTTNKLNESAVNAVRTLQLADDASTGFFSETGSLYSTASKNRRSRRARLLLRQRSKERIRNISGGRVASGSDSVALSTGGGSTKLSGTKRRGGKRKKNAKSPLHDLELPMPTDASVASAVEEGRYLRALMQYDEADQDWL